MNSELIQSARSRNLQISRVRVRDKNGEHYYYFLKDGKGRLLNNGDSFDYAEVQSFFQGASLQEPTGNN